MSNAQRGRESTIEIEDILGTYGAAGTYYGVGTATDVSENVSNNEEESTVFEDAGIESHKLIDQGVTYEVSLRDKEPEDEAIQLIQDWEDDPFAVEGMKFRYTKFNRTARIFVGIMSSISTSNAVKGLINGSFTVTRDGAFL